MNVKIITERCSLPGVIGWFFYDWANSAYPSIVITFIFATYFTKNIAANPILGTAQWGDAIAIAGIIIALLSPILGAIADYEGRRKPWLLACTLLNVFASTMLWFSHPSTAYIDRTLFFVIMGTVGLEVATVFYNAMLSDIAPKGYIGRFSGWGWGFGYFGGLTSLIIALFVFAEGHLSWLDINQMEQIRITGPFTALWVIAFSWPIFIFTPDQPSKGIRKFTAIKKGLIKLYETIASLKNYRHVMLFLIARMIYVDGLNTIFAFGGIYAAGTFGMSFQEVVEFGIAMNVAAGIGAAMFAWMDDFKGSKITIMTTLVIMIISGTSMLFITSKTLFWVLGMFLSLCTGPIQSASRSLMIHIVPKDMIVEMFGLYAFSGKATAFLGPWILAMVTLHFNSQRAGMTTVVVFMIVGLIILQRVKANDNYINT